MGKEVKEKVISVSKDGKMKQVVRHTKAGYKNRKGQEALISQTLHIKNEK